MTIVHLLIGLILGKKFGYTSVFVFGSVLPDIDHLAVSIRHRHFRPGEIFRAMKYEDRYGERYKTSYTHSLLAWLIFSAIAIIFNLVAGIAFSVAYLLHLILDAFDKDEMQLFYPFKKTLRGFLPVFSAWEIVVGAVLLAIYFII